MKQIKWEKKRERERGEARRKKEMGGERVPSSSRKAPVWYPVRLILMATAVTPTRTLYHQIVYKVQVEFPLAVHVRSSHWILFPVVAIPIFERWYIICDVCSTIKSATLTTASTFNLGISKFWIPSLLHHLTKLQSHRMQVYVCLTYLGPQERGFVRS